MLNSSPPRSNRIPPLRGARQARGLSLKQVSALTGIDKAQLSRVERGHGHLSLPALLRVARALGLIELERLLHPYIEEVKANDTRPTLGQRPKSRPTSR